MMRRTRRREKKASAILTADLHLTEFTPVSRTDEYLEAQEQKLIFLQQLSIQNGGCPILCAGDLFDRWKTSPWFNSWVYNILPTPLVTIPGNHDLPMHSFESYPKSAMSLLETVMDGEDFMVLKMGKALSIGENLTIYGIPFGLIDSFNSEGHAKFPDVRKILLLHEMVWEDRKPIWAQNAYSGKEILAKFGDYFDLIVTGDNHESFVVSDGESLLVNPGSMLRRTADQADFQPRCFLYYGEENEVVPMEFPIDVGVHNREHLDRVKEHDARTAAYIMRLSQNWKGGLSFRDNLQAFFTENGTPKKVRELIYSVLEDS